MILFTLLPTLFSFRKTALLVRQKQSLPSQELEKGKIKTHTLESHSQIKNKKRFKVNTHRKKNPHKLHTNYFMIENFVFDQDCRFVRSITGLFIIISKYPIYFFSPSLKIRRISSCAASSSPADHTGCHWRFW